MARQPEDKLIRHVMAKTGRSKGRTIAILKASGQIKQAGRHLQPTAKGKKAIAKVRNRSVS